jgi:hypothetical protein
MKAAVPTSTAVFAISPSGSFALTGRLKSNCLIRPQAAAHFGLADDPPLFGCDAI